MNTFGLVCAIEVLLSGGDNDMREKSVGALLTFGGLVVVLVGWAITEWVYSSEYYALNSLLEPLGTILRYGGFIMLLAGIAWYGRLYYRVRNAKQ